MQRWFRPGRQNFILIYAAIFAVMLIVVAILK